MKALPFFWDWPGEVFAIPTSLRQWVPWHGCANVNNTHPLRTLSCSLCLPFPYFLSAPDASWLLVHWHLYTIFGTWLRRERYKHGGPWCGLYRSSCSKTGKDEINKQTKQPQQTKQNPIQSSPCNIHSSGMLIGSGPQVCAQFFCNLVNFSDKVFLCCCFIFFVLWWAILFMPLRWLYRFVYKFVKDRVTCCWLLYNRWGQTPYPFGEETANDL